MKDSRPVLLVEDDTVDAMAVRRAFRDLKLMNPLVHTTNGEEALVYLKDEAHDQPCVILLDLNMPRMNGIELLGILKADPVLRKIPVVVLTTSGEQPDVTESFRQRVAGYIIKPVDYRNFVDVVRTIDLYWSLSELPSGNGEVAHPQYEAAAAGTR